MKQIKETMITALSIGLITIGTAFGGPCCMDRTKECPKSKQCVKPAKDCPAKKSCDSAAAQQSNKTESPDKAILFFMNPNGRPCQLQLAVLEGMKDKLIPLANVTYIKTTESNDREKFSEYGIRGLPSLIIVDKNGKEISRFQPGIQDEETILSALKKNR